MYPNVFLRFQKLQVSVSLGLETFCKQYVSQSHMDVETMQILPASKFQLWKPFVEIVISILYRG